MLFLQVIFIYIATVLIANVLNNSNGVILDSLGPLAILSLKRCKIPPHVREKTIPCNAQCKLFLNLLSTLYFFPEIIICR